MTSWHVSARSDGSEPSPRRRCDPVQQVTVTSCAIARKKGSSRISGKGRSDLEEEVGVVTKAVGHAFDDLDLVVDPLDQIGAERIAAMGEDAGQVGPQREGES